MKSGISFQPKPESSHYVTIHNCYRDITDGTASTAALLSVLEYLAESTFASSATSKLPDSIVIAGNCNNPLLRHLLDGLIGETAIKSKLKVLNDLGFITINVTNGSRRVISYHRKAISDALKRWVKGSRSDPSENDPSKSDDSNGVYPSKSDGYPSKSDPLTRQKVTPTIHITNHSSSQIRTNRENVQEKGRNSSGVNLYHPGLTPYQGSNSFMEERPWINRWNLANPEYNEDFIRRVIEYLGKNERYSNGANRSDAIGYVGKVNKTTPEQVDTERLQRLNALWVEFIDGMVAKLEPKAPQDGRPTLTPDQLQQLSDLDFMSLTAEEAMLVNPSFKVDITPDWTNVRVLS